MATPTDSAPLPARVQTSFQKLATAASALNSASDRFAKLVAEIDATLKPLNIGIPCWVQAGPRWCSDFNSGYEQIGYAKINGKWGIALRSIEEFDHKDDDIEEWAYSEGPRRLKLKAIDYLPELLDELAKQAVDSTKSVTQKSADLEELVRALKEGGSK